MTMPDRQTLQRLSDEAGHRASTRPTMHRRVVLRAPEQIQSLQTQTTGSFGRHCVVAMPQR